MSIRWALMSSRPSSNTANRPTGPAPMIIASVRMISLMVSALSDRRRHDEAVENRGNLDLARKTRIGADVGGEVEHVLLHLRGLADDLAPLRRHIDVAGRAGASAAALGLDAGNTVAQRGLHHRRA